MARARALVTLVCALFLLGGCSRRAEPAHSAPDRFQIWLAAAPDRTAAFDRFVAFLQANGVENVVPPEQLWRVDKLRPRCSTESFAAPPESAWQNIAPTLRFLRDHVKPALGELEVVAAYRDPVLNDCVGGASRSVHRAFRALDLVPVDARIKEADLARLLCPIHAAEGRRAQIGLGIYRARRFHVDSAGYRGWGHDHRGATFPCAAMRAP